MKGKKAQAGLENAPSIILIVGLIFLTMATLAFMGEKYGSTMDTENVAGTVVNETLTTVTQTPEVFAVSTLEDVVCNSVTAVYNTSHFVIASGNYSQTGCTIRAVGASHNNTNWKVSYTYTHTVETVASNLTTDLNIELDNNSSIAGIVLTISLVGIVLTILIGVFLGFSRRTRI